MNASHRPPSDPPRPTGLLPAVAAVAWCCALGTAALAAPDPPPPQETASPAPEVRPTWITEAPEGYGSEWIARFGWSAVDLDGSPRKVLEYEDSRASPFWDLDGLRSDGRTTLDASLTGTDREANRARVYYYRSGTSVHVDYERFLRRKDHDPLANFPRDPGPDNLILGEDLNVGEDYAIRVQQFKTRFQGPLADNVKWRLNLWGMRREGERQATAMVDAFFESDLPSPGPVGRVFNQVQRIDWLTMEIEPVIEGAFGALNVEYSRPMRSFRQEDQPLSLAYAPFAGAPPQYLEGTYPYAFVPDSQAWRDQVKIGCDVSEDMKFYGLLYTGGMTSEFRGLHRAVNGFDLRLINRSMENVTLTGYAKRHDELYHSPPYLLPEEQAAELRPPQDYRRTAAGIKSVWRPHGGGFGQGGPAVGLGYEYRMIDRDFVQNLYHILDVAPSYRWSEELDTWVRYRWANSFRPLLGVRASNHELNTIRPEDTQRVDLGGTWSPGDNLVLHGSAGFERQISRSPVANFTNVLYPVTVGATYTVTERWALSAGYASFVDSLDQDIRLGDEAPQFPGDPRLSSVTSHWIYYGRSQVLDFGTHYEVTDRLRLVGDVQFVQGHNAAGAPAPWSDLPGYFAVDVRETRLGAGFDWQLRDRVGCYFRYIYDEYEDLTAAYNNGSANIFLAGLSGVF